MTIPHFFAVCDFKLNRTHFSTRKVFHSADGFFFFFFASRFTTHFSLLVSNSKWALAHWPSLKWAGGTGWGGGWRLTQESYLSGKTPPVTWGETLARCSTAMIMISPKMPPQIVRCIKNTFSPLPPPDGDFPLNRVDDLIHKPRKNDSVSWLHVFGRRKEGGECVSGGGEGGRSGKWSWAYHGWFDNVGILIRWLFLRLVEVFQRVRPLVSVN